MKTSAYSQAQPGKAGAGKYAENYTPILCRKNKDILPAEDCWDERQVATRLYCGRPLLRANMTAKRMNRITPRTASSLSHHGQWGVTGCRA